MTEKPTTHFSNKCDILAELWGEYKNDVQFEDFIEYNDLGLPLAYSISTGIIPVSPRAEMFVNETFDLFLVALERQDEGFESLEDLLLLDGE